MQRARLRGFCKKATDGAVDACPMLMRPKCVALPVLRQAPPPPRLMDADRPLTESHLNVRYDVCEDSVDLGDIARGDSRQLGNLGSGVTSNPFGQI